MTVCPTDRLTLFIDGPNLQAAAKALSFNIDYRSLLSEFGDRGILVRAFYYTTLSEADVPSPIRPLVDWLGYNGFTAVTKSQREVVDENGRRRPQGNLDIEVVCDMLEAAERSNHMVLFTGNDNFLPLIEAVRRRGARVTLVSTVKTSPPMTSDQLRRRADTFIDLTDPKLRLTCGLVRAMPGTGKNARLRLIHPRFGIAPC